MQNFAIYNVSKQRKTTQILHNESRLENALKTLHGNLNNLPHNKVIKNNFKLLKT